jgi:hypothetical protein
MTIGLSSLRPAVMLMLPTELLQDSHDTFLSGIHALGYNQDRTLLLVQDHHPVHLAHTQRLPINPSHNEATLNLWIAGYSQ